MTDLNKRKLIIVYSVAGALFVAITGTLAHFIYDWTMQNKIIGLFTAVNESTWEHMKLIFFPMLLFALFIYVKLHKKVPEALPSILIAELAGTWLIPVLFYTYTGILGFMITAVNLIIFYVSVLISYLLFYFITVKYNLCKLNILLYLIITIFICMFFMFTYDPPELGIFIDPVQ